MDQPFVVVLITLVVVFGLVVLLLFVFGGGDTSRMSVAGRGFWRTLRDRGFADSVGEILAPPPPKPATLSRPSGVPLRSLALLQREGRLVDFLLEDIQNYPDAQ